MDFFYDLFLKIKNYLLIIFLFILILIINDIIIVFKCKIKTYNDDSSIIADNIKNSVLDNSSNVIKEDEVSVDVKGYVKKPNVYKLNTNNNVLDAINMAGGLKKQADTSNINLSKKLKDEMVIFVDKKQSSQNNVSTFNDLKKEDRNYNVINNDALYIKSDTPVIELNNTFEKNSNLVSINLASKEDLLTISGIGPSKADAIIKYRENNKFEKIEDILNVPGIGDALFEKIKDRITL